MLNISYCGKISVVVINVNDRACINVIIAVDLIRSVKISSDLNVRSIGTSGLKSLFCKYAVGFGDIFYGGYKCNEFSVVSIIIVVKIGIYGVL